MAKPLRLAAGRPVQLQYPGCVRKDLKLLEVDEAMLQELQTRGCFIKGGSGTDEAVLCTKDRTFGLKRVQTTNTVLLVPPPIATAGAAATAAEPGEAAAVTVGGEADHHMEAVLVAPRLGNLDSMLPVYDCEEDMMQQDDAAPMEATEAFGGDSWQEASANGATAAPLGFDALLKRVQGSEQELRQALRQRGALELGGSWWRLDPELLGTLLEVLILSATQHGWPRDAVPETAAVAALQGDGFDARVVRHCLGQFCSPTEAATASANGGDRHWALDRRKVAQHFARRLLAQQAQWEQAEFMAAWQAALPEGIVADPAVLAGEALVESEGRLRAFPVSALPVEPGARFAALFAARRRWAAADIQPFLAGVQAPGQSAEALLLRHARASQAAPGQSTCYNAR